MHERSSPKYLYRNWWYWWGLLPYGWGLASVLSSKVPGMSATAEVTGGSVDNLNLIGSGKPYVGFSMADAAKDAQTGEGKFSGKKVDLKKIGRAHV